MKRMQRGMTLIGFLLVLAVAGVFIYMGMKLVPMYAEYYAVKRALNEMAADPGMANRSPQQIRDLFFRRLYVSYADNIKTEHVKILRKDQGFEMTVKYEVRKPLIYNLDVVGNFEAVKEMRRGGID